MSQFPLFLLLRASSTYMEQMAQHLRRESTELENKNKPALRKIDGFRICT